MEPLELGGVASPIRLLGCCCSGLESESSSEQEPEEDGEESESEISMTMALLFLLPCPCCSSLGSGRPSSGEGEGGNLVSIFCSFLLGAPAPITLAFPFCIALLTCGAGVGSLLASGTVRSRKNDGSRRLRSAEAALGGEERLGGEEESVVGLRGEEEWVAAVLRLGREREAGRERGGGGGGMEERRGNEAEGC